jgi:hypothetical protein
MGIRQRQIAFAIMAALSNTSALALVGGSVDDNLAGSSWAGVGAVTINGQVFSGTLLDSWHVLTAAHVVNGQVGTPGNVSFSLNAGGNLTQTLSATSISVYSGYTGTAPGTDGVWHDDLAIITLSAPAAATVPTYGLYSGSLSGQTLTLVGYGAGGDGVNGVTSGSNATVKRVGQNNVDRLLVDDDGGSFNEVFEFDFDGPDSSSNLFGPSKPANLTLGATVEAQFAGGDSGSSVFVYDGGMWKIAGVANFNGGNLAIPGSNVLFGSFGGGTIVAPYISWIQSTVAAPVPEPETWTMLLVGMGLVGAAVRAKSRT